MGALAWILFVTGVLICAGNAYLALLRYPLHRLKGGTKGDYQIITGWPIIGLILMWAGAINTEFPDWMLYTAIGITILDSLVMGLPIMDRRKNCGQQAADPNRDGAPSE